MSILLYLLLLPPLIFILSQTLTILGLLLKSSPLEFYGRSLASFLALFLCAVYGTLASALLNLAGYGGLGQWTTARAFKWTMWVCAGVWFEIDEESRKTLDGNRPAVFVGNHQTELDVLYLGHVFPRYCSVTAKRSLMFVPVLGWFSKSHHCILNTLGPGLGLVGWAVADTMGIRSGSQQNRLHRTLLPHSSLRSLRRRRKRDAHTSTIRLHLPRRHKVLLRSCRLAVLQKGSFPPRHPGSGSYCAHCGGELF